eukprot:scaffold1396_cov252-Pinguiococcus_pyrenoidosus.AAC.7
MVARDVGGKQRWCYLCRELVQLAPELRQPLINFLHRPASGEQVVADVLQQEDAFSLIEVRFLFLQGCVRDVREVVLVLLHVIVHGRRQEQHSVEEEHLQGSCAERDLGLPSFPLTELSRSAWPAPFAST